jgi:NAD(P)-dependent dehydrogenase (short-subunit alcohol dehydrogenase family)
MNEESLNERVVLVTGATGVLGQVVAGRFAAAGARLGLVGTHLDRLTGLARDLGLVADRWAPGIGDLTDREEARVAVKSVTDRLGRVDVVLHLVGGWTGGTAVVDLDPGELRTMLDQHLWTTLNVVQATVPAMIAAGWGRVAAVGSRPALEASPKSASYAVAKAAEDTLLRTVAREVAGTGVTVNLVTVGTIDEEHERDSSPTPKNATWTTPEEIAAALLYLCSDEASAVNGARLPLDHKG